MMKVLIVAPFQTFMFFGGLRTQIERTVSELNKIGCSTQFWDGRSEIRKADFDLVHVFSMNAPTYFQSIALKKYGMPLVFSSVMWRSGSRFMLRSITNTLDKAPFFLLTDTIACKKLAKIADLILPNTVQEKEWLSDVCSVDKEKCIVVPNGADNHFEGKDIESVDLNSFQHEYVLSISVISPRKNIIRLAEATHALALPLVHVGGSLDDNYLKKLKKFDNITFLGQKNNKDPLIGSLMKNSKVFALVSEYETPGIAALEAGLQGANCVLTQIGGAEEYFGDNARYVDPFSRSDIEMKLKEAWSNPLGGDLLASHLKNNYGWDTVARKTKMAYERIL